jgi:hypothetical protein
VATKPLSWKVYTPAPREYVAACKRPEEAAILVAALGTGAQIKFEHHTPVWTEGEEDQSAADSYDHVAETCLERVNKQRVEAKRQFDAEQHRIPADCVACLKYDDGSQFGAIVLNSACETWDKATALLEDRKANGHAYRAERVVRMLRSLYETAMAEALKVRT